MKCIHSSIQSSLIPGQLSAWCFHEGEKVCFSQCSLEWNRENEYVLRESVVQLASIRYLHEYILQRGFIRTACITGAG